MTRRTGNNYSGARWAFSEGREAARERRQRDAAAKNTRHIRYHTCDDMTGLGEFRDTVEPVAVVLRQDGSVDVYGYVAVIDQRPDFQ